MRREGGYSSSLSTWRRQREAAELAALAPQNQKTNADRYAHVLFGEGDRIKTAALHRIQSIVG